jgi:leucyl aminopeptidase (aminopeptidase T)
MINRDELSHVRLYQKLTPEAMQLFPHSHEQIYEMFAIAVEHECKWAGHIRLLAKVTKLLLYQSDERALIRNCTDLQLRWKRSPKWWCRLR